MLAQIEDPGARAAAGVSECVLLGGLDGSRDSPQSNHLQINSIGPHPMLSAIEERALVERAQAGDLQAEHRLLLAHLPLARRIARKYRSGADREWDDLDAEAFLGLKRALATFDAERGFRFNTFARWWIVEAVSNYAKRSRSVVRGPSRGNGHGNDVSLNAPAEHEDGEGHQAIDDLADDDAVDPEAAVVRHEEGALAHETVHEALDSLDDRERRIFTARRLSDDPPTLRELGAQIGLTAERVRQIEAVALDKVSARVRQFPKNISRAVFNDRGRVPPAGPLTPLDDRLTSGRAYPSLTALLMGDPIGISPAAIADQVVVIERRQRESQSGCRFVPFKCEVIEADFRAPPCRHRDAMAGLRRAAA
jgi:RNA polymerase sigma-32 factor